MSTESVQHVGDAAAGGIALATVLKWLPEVAAALSVIWMIMRIYDWIEGRWKARKGK
jgi:hypothetical protein